MEVGVIKDTSADGCIGHWVWDGVISFLAGLLAIFWGLWTATAAAAIGVVGVVRVIRVVWNVGIIRVIWKVRIIGKIGIIRVAGKWAMGMTRCLC